MGDEQSAENFIRVTRHHVHRLTCIECLAVSYRNARGWRAVRIGDREEDEPPAVAFYCPRCSESEFGG